MSTASRPESPTPGASTRSKRIRLIGGAILATLVLVAALWPPQQAVRHAARRTRCRNNLKQLGLALHNYVDVYGVFPAPATMGDAPPRSWRVELLPYLDQPTLRETYRDGLPWDSPQNQSIALQRLDVYLCPSAKTERDASGRYYTSYVGVVGPHTLFADGQRRSFASILDGAAQTIAVVENCDAHIIWTEPRDVRLEEASLTINGGRRRPPASNSVIASPHLDCGYVLFADGSVLALPDRIDPTVLKALLTIDGGENVSDEDYRPR